MTESKPRSHGQAAEDRIKYLDVLLGEAQDILHETGLSPRQLAERNEELLKIIGFVRADLCVAQGFEIIPHDAIMALINFIDGRLPRAKGGANV